jgi:UDP-3-O-[3-hydroxymyristoyl] N-acetylglucosamine deacetylase
MSLRLSEVVVEGVGLHTGAPARVALRAQPGPVVLVANGVAAPIAELEVVSTARATTVEARGGAVRVGTVEHLFAALGGLGVYEGVAVVVDGPEVPIVDGGAAAWCEALTRLGAPRSAPKARIAREAVIEVGPSRYELSPGIGSGADAEVEVGVEVEVRLELDDPRIAPDARWRGDALDFAARIAPARTFALARDVDELLRRGLARHVDPACAVVIAPDAIHHAGKAFSADEPARHKVLDLVGDLYLRGGPPSGRLRAVRPGHASNARFLRRAIEDGILVPSHSG